MNRKQFMEELSQLLIGISEEERVEALQYYEDYFDDAGAENEQQVIEELGTPQKVASTICLNLEPGSEQNGEFTESGFQDERFEEKATPAARSSRTKEGNTYSYNEAFGEQDYHSSYIPIGDDNGWCRIDYVGTWSGGNGCNCKIVYGYVSSNISNFC